MNFCLFFFVVQKSVSNVRANCQLYKKNHTWLLDTIQNEKKDETNKQFSILCI